MVVVSYSGKEINAKVVYYGPGLSGKTTNLEYIYGAVPQNSRGKMVSMKTRTERTLFFDFLPVELGQLGGFKTRFLLYTVPGQIYYNATRKLVLRGVDAVVFVADSQRGKMKENIESLQNLRDNLKDYDLDLDKLPWCIQYNKRDLEEVYSIEELEKDMNPAGVPYFEAVATTGEGVFECFRGIGKILMKKLTKEIKLEERPARTLTIAEVPAAGAPVAGSPPPPGVRTQSAPRAATPPPPAPTAAPALAASTPPASASPAATPPAATPPAAKAAPGDLGKKSRKAKKKARRSSDHTGEKKAEERTSKPGGTASIPVTVPPSADMAGEEEQKPGLLSRLFGRGRKREDEETPEVPETRIQRLDLPVPGAEHDAPQAGKTVIEKRVSVPVTLSPEEVQKGTTLRLILDIQVRQESSESEAA
jgi:hypothetical protein